jgi:flagellar assembly factor FliW
MQLVSSRFGVLAIAAEDVLYFPAGLPGLENCRTWVLLADARHEALAWLHSVSQPQVALAVVSPCRFVPGYRLRVSPKEITALGLDSLRDVEVLAIVSSHAGQLTANLKAPLLIHPAKRLGRQVIASDDQPLRFVLPRRELALRRSA